MDSDKKTVLIVEDNASLRDILVQFVKRVGHQALQAETGDAALDGSPTLVLTLF